MVRETAPPEQVRRGRPPKTSREAIAAAALDLAGRGGADAVTIRRLAEEMGLSSRTLYSYVTTKDEIVDLMTEAALAPFEFSPQPGQTLTEQLYSGFLSLYETMRTNPVAIDLFASTNPNIRASADRIREDLMTVMTRHGMSRQRAVDVFIALCAHVVGVVTVETARERRADELTAHVAALPPDLYPAITAAPEAWASPLSHAAIEESLHLLVDGLCRPRASGPAPR